MAYEVMACILDGVITIGIFGGGNDAFLLIIESLLSLRPLSTITRIRKKKKKKKMAYFHTWEWKEGKGKEEKKGAGEERGKEVGKGEREGKGRVELRLRGSMLIAPSFWNKREKAISVTLNKRDHQENKW
jgi:hypothetical protein